MLGSRTLSNARKFHGQRTHNWQQVHVDFWRSWRILRCTNSRYWLSGNKRMVRSNLNGVMIPKRVSVMECGEDCVTCQGSDQTSPKNGSSSPSTRHGWPVGNASSIPPLHQLSTFKPKVGWRTSTLGWWNRRSFLILLSKNSLILAPICGRTATLRNSFSRITTSNSWNLPPRVTVPTSNGVITLFFPPLRL